MILSQQWSKYYMEEILNPCNHGWVMCTCQNLSFKMTWTNFAKLNFYLCCSQKILKGNSFVQDGNLGLDIAMKFYWNLLSVCSCKFCGGSLTPGITILIKQAWWEYYNNTSLWLLMMFLCKFFSPQCAGSLIYRRLIFTYHKPGPCQQGFLMPNTYSMNIKNLLSLIAETKGPVFCLLLGISSDYAQPITGQVTEVTCPVIGRAQPELTPSKRQKTAQISTIFVHIMTT